MLFPKDAIINHIVTLKKIKNYTYKTYKTQISSSGDFKESDCNSWSTRTIQKFRHIPPTIPEF